MNLWYVAGGWPATGDQSYDLSFRHLDRPLSPTNQRYTYVRDHGRTDELDEAVGIGVVIGLGGQVGLP